MITNKTILLLGSSSDIAHSVKDFLHEENKIISVNRSVLDLAKDNSTKKIQSMLSVYDPDIVINCAGVLGDNTTDFNEVFDVNVRSNWAVIDFYNKRPPEKQVKFIMLGSSTYKQGRKNFILYAASKAALYNMWQGASEACSENLLLGLVNPVRVNTKMVSHLTHANPEVCLEASDVAKEIVRLCEEMTHSESIDMDYKGV